MHPDDGRIEALLRALDHPVPPVTADAIASRASRRARPERWAAGILLLLGAAGAAFALPGSPLRSWAIGVATRLTRGSEAPPRGPGQEDEHGSAGIAVDAGRSLVIRFAEPAGGLVRVTLTGRPEVMVRASAGGASFTSEDQRLEIVDRDAPDTFAIEVPRDAPRVEILLGGSRLFLSEVGRVTAAVPADSTGVYRLPLGRETIPRDSARPAP